MKIYIFLLWIFLLGCNSSQNNAQQVSVKLVLEVIELKDRQESEHCIGLLARAQIRNNTHQKVFIMAPALEALQFNGASFELTSAQMPIDFKLDIYPPDYFENLMDTIKNQAFGLADYIVKTNTSPPNRLDIQRKVLASSILFLDPFETKEVVRGVTFLKEPGKSIKLVASNSRSVEDYDKILGKIPDMYNGYIFRKEPLLSDTLVLKFR
jgi:hypothetical protein